MTKILVIEDTHSLRRDIIEMLGYEGFDALGAEDGVAGVKLALEYVPDLIICDILMPGLDGYGVLDEIKKDPVLATKPFIFLTAKADKSDIRRGMEMGAYDYLTKPFSASELIAAVHTQLHKRDLLTRMSEKRLDALRENIILALPHELRTPLTSILGFSELIISDYFQRDAEQIIEMAQYINSAGARLYRLAENYLAYAQLEVMYTSPEWAEVLKEYATNDQAWIVEHQAVRKAQEFSREADLMLSIDRQDVTVRILGDHLKKIVEELVDNAFKFSPPQTPVDVITEVARGRYVLTVIDRGRGMTAEQISSIGAYMQFGRQWLEQQGLGLGLIVAKRLAQLYGGEMAIDSAPDQYTRVIVGLPLA